MYGRHTQLSLSTRDSMDKYLKRSGETQDAMTPP